MTVQSEVEREVLAEMEKRRERTKPTMEFAHHIACTHSPQMRMTVKLTDGTIYERAQADFVFTDGLAIVHQNHRIYLPKTSISSILIHNPGEK